MWKIQKYLTTLFAAMFLCSACQFSDHETQETLELIFDNATAEWVNCHSFNPENPQSNRLKFAKNCGQIDKNGLVRFTQNFMNYKPKPRVGILACAGVYKGKSNPAISDLGDFYITPDGFGRGHNDSMDSRCYFGEMFQYNLLKTYVEGNLAYVDDSLLIVQQTEFVFGSNFDDGRAVVCSTRPVKKWAWGFSEYVWSGGKCGQIDRDFKVIAPVEHPYEYFTPLPDWLFNGFMLRSAISANSGMGEELEKIIKNGTHNMAGNTRFEIFRFRENPDVLIIDEHWIDKKAHEESLTLKPVMASIEKGKSLITSIKRLDEHEHIGKTLVDPRVKEKNFSLAISQSIYDVFDALKGEKEKCAQKYVDDYEEQVMNYCLQSGYAYNIGGGCYHKARSFANSTVLQQAMDHCASEN